MLTVSELFIYPIKSLGGLSVPCASVTDRGFEYDRRWMLVDMNNRFLTQRAVPKMALLQVKLTGEGLKVHHKTKDDSINIPLTPQTSETALAQIWDDECRVQWVSAAVDCWFSDMLSIQCRLVYMPDTTYRNVDSLYAANNEITSLSDAYPFLIIGQASLDDLNSRMDEALPMNRFRPNIVFTGGAPFQEDTMEQFVINNIQMFGVKLCARCMITTINQQNGECGKEPLKTLATYRMKNNKIYFGQNVLAHGTGQIQVGNSIHIVKEKMNEPFAM